FNKPSLIQQKAIRPILDGRDVIAQAQSGTGKTATFSIGTLQNVRCEVRKLQVLILSPTRELANQTHQVISSLSDYLPIRCVACYGGRNNVTQMVRELSNGAHIVVGTPGRVLDLIRQGSLRLDSVRSLVLDEADEMLNRGLRTQLEEIYRRLPFGNGDLQISNTSSTQVIIISATMPHEQLEVFYRFTKNPVQVLVPRDELTLAGLHQFYVDVGSEEWKFEALGDLFASVCVPQTVVFVNTRRKADWLSTQLRRDSYTVEAAHGDLDQALRETVMERFRSGASHTSFEFQFMLEFFLSHFYPKSRILVCSDIWARGIDVQNVGLVVNYDLPATPSDYLHRIGRSGRFGRRGLAVSFVAGADDRRKLDAIARQYRIAIPPAPAALDKMLTWSDSPTSVDPAPTSLSAQELKSVVQSIKAKGRKRKRPKKRKNKISSQ
ncbi:ATP-dependent RNA helicase FAL1, partial [Clonorchis sinensis]